MNDTVLQRTNLLICPRKLSRVAMLVRGSSLLRVFQVLPFLPQKGARLLLKLLRCSLGQVGLGKVSLDDGSLTNYFLHRLEVNDGLTIKSSFFRAKGKVDKRRRRFSSVRVVIRESSSPPSSALLAKQAEFI